MWMLGQRASSPPASPALCSPVPREIELNQMLCELDCLGRVILAMSFVVASGVYGVPGISGESLSCPL